MGLQEYEGVTKNGVTSLKAKGFIDEFSFIF